jgi:hypothetical protein
MTAMNADCAHERATALRSLKPSVSQRHHLTHSGTPEA